MGCDGEGERKFVLSDEKVQNLNTQWMLELCYYKDRRTQFTQEIKNRMDSLYLYHRKCADKYSYVG